MLLALAAAPSTTTASSQRPPSSAAKPVLAWSTSTFVEETQGHWREQSMLWIGAADGSHPRPLGEGGRPRISPDGRWVAFSRDKDAYVVATTGGRARLVARNAQPVHWSPSSRLLAMVAQGRALYVTDIETRRRVTIDSAATIFSPSFSPSGKDIVWARQRGRVYILDGDIDLFRARVDGSARTRLTEEGRNSAPIWGPARIAFGRIRPSGDVHFPIYELWTMRPQGDGLRRLTRTSHLPIGWSADGGRLLTSTYSTSGAVASVVDVGTGSVRTLLNGKDVFTLALSRDGRSVLAWVRTGLNPPFGPRGDLVQVNWDGSRRVLVKDGDEWADWNL